MKWYWLADGFLPMTFCLAAFWLLWHTSIAVRDTRDLIAWIWRKRHRTLTPGAPDGDYITRITSSHWPPPDGSRPPRRRARDDKPPAASGSREDQRLAA